MPLRASFIVLVALGASACAAPSSSEDAFVDEQEVGKTKRVAFPDTPFAQNACTGVPIDEGGLAKKLGKRTSKKVGSFVYAIQHRAADSTWNDRHWDTTYRWVDAPNDTLTAWRDNGTATHGPSVFFTKRGDLEVFRDDAGVHLRLVSAEAEIPSPDTTDGMRLVFGPMQPWKLPGRAVGVGPSLERTIDDGKTWSPVTSGWAVHTSAYAVASYHRVVWFEGNDAVSIVTERCGQIVSSRQIGGLSPISASIAIFFAFD